MEVVGASRQGTSSGNGDASINMVPPRECCIYKVPKKLKKINEEAYTPLRVSIGPLHHGKEGLEDMEEHKLRYFNDFLQQSGKSSTELVEIMMHKEKEIHENYAETINLNSELFWQIILVDAVFIIQVLLKCWFGDLRTPNDRIFGKPWMLNDIKYDLLLLENQLPFSALQYLFEMTKQKLGIKYGDNMPDSFFRLTLVWLESVSIIQKLPVLENVDPSEVNPSEVQHFLDLLRSCLIRMEDSQASVPEEIKPSKVKQFNDFQRSHLKPRQSLQQTEREFEFPPTATELHEAGVKFKVNSSKNLFDIKFSGDVLEMPHVKIYDSTECLLRNIIAYEKCHCDFMLMLDYTILMDSLINTRKDVELLVQAKVIENWLGDNDDVSNLFNGLGKGAVFYSGGCHFTKLHRELNDYCKIRKHKWKATLRHNYCNTPWRVLSIIVAAILLGLIFIQSLCSLITCHK